MYHWQDLISAKHSLQLGFRIIMIFPTEQKYSVAYSTAKLFGNRLPVSYLSSSYASEEIFG